MARWRLLNLSCFLIALAIFIADLLSPGHLKLAGSKQLGILVQKSLANDFNLGVIPDANCRSVVTALDQILQQTGVGCWEKINETKSRD